MSEELKPCPHCGPNVIGNNRPIVMSDETGFFVACKNCGALGPNKDSQEESIEAWGIRTPATLPTVEELRDMFRGQEGIYINLHQSIFLATITLDYLTRRMGGESTSEKPTEPGKGSGE